MNDFLTKLFSIQNFIGVDSVGILWINILVMLYASFCAEKGKFNPKKNTFTLSKNVNQELNLDYLKICTFSIAMYIVIALVNGISSKGVTMLYSTMSIYIAVFGLYTLHNAKNRIDSVDIEKFKSKFDGKNINLEESIKKVKHFIFLVNLVLVVSLVINSTIMITSIFCVINWLWIASFSLLFISFLGQSSIILIDKLVNKD